MDPAMSLARYQCGLRVRQAALVAPLGSPLSFQIERACVGEVLADPAASSGREGPPPPPRRSLP